MDNSTRHEGGQQRLAKAERMSQRDGLAIWCILDAARCAHSRPVRTHGQKKRSQRYTWLIRIEPSITGKPKSENRQKLIG